MTTTNQAFIKAYRKDEPQPAPTAPTAPAMAGTARHAGPAAPVAVTSQREAAAHTVTPTTERSAIYKPFPATRTADQPVTRTDAPQQRTLTSESPGLSRRDQQISLPSQKVTRELPQKTSGRPANEKRPLSAFIASTGIARLNTEPAEGDFFRPGNTVASFHWPAVCRTLSRQCGAELGQVADMLVSHAAAGRSLIGVVGLKPHDGATTAAICLAMRLADRHRRTILVDANFKHPQLANVLEAEPTSGWQEVLKYGSPLTDAAVRATDDRVDLLALSAKMPKDLQRCISGLQAVVTAGVLRHAYENVIFDLGAFLDVASQPILLELVRNMGVDAVIAVTRPGAPVARDVDTLADQLARSGCELLGTIENRH
jgi:Mrp family chromosome partitioning ATPase